jgi:hypothetical protein
MHFFCLQRNEKIQVHHMYTNYKKADMQKVGVV